MAKVFLKFLGTGGGRFSTITQERSTAGCLLEAGVRFHIDPGPGALLRSRIEREDPTRVRAVLVTHAHPDHYCEAEVAVEAMTKGGAEKRGLLAGSLSVIDGTATHGPVVSKYYKARPEEVFAVRQGDNFKVGPVSVRATPSFHSDETTVGFRFHTEEGAIGYLSDTSYDAEVVAAHKGSRLLVLPATRPRRSRIRWHLASEDVVEILKAVRPEMAVLNHLGLRMLRAGPEKEAEWIEKVSGVRTVAGFDGMQVAVADEVAVVAQSAPPKHAPLAEVEIDD